MIDEKALLERLTQTLDYYLCEFPKDKYPGVWSTPIAVQLEGLTPDDLITVKQFLSERASDRGERGAENGTGAQTADNALLRECAEVLEQCKDALDAVGGCVVGISRLISDIKSLLTKLREKRL